MSDYSLFTISFYLLAVIGLTIKIILNIINIQHIVANSSSIPSKFSDKINLSEHQQAADYSTAKLKFSIVTICIHFCLLLIWIPWGGLNWLDTWARTFGQNEILSGMIFFGSYILIGVIIDLPESLYQTFKLEEKFGFNKTTPKIFIQDLVKQLLLSIVLGMPLIYILLKIISGLGSYWWIYAWIFMTLFQFFIIWAYPKFIAPLFNKFSKMDSPELKEEIDLLIKRCDLTFKDYYIMNASLRSSHGNAYFTGFGKNKRIVFFDTLISSLTTNEIISVLAHELGHLKHKHIIKSLISGILFMGVGFYILGLCYKSELFFSSLAHVNKSSYMAIMLFSFLTPIYTFLFTPLKSWISRRNEYQADKFASTHASGDELISALIKMYKDNSNSLTPSPIYSKFYYSHPPALERVHYIESLRVDRFH